MSVIKWKSGLALTCGDPAKGLGETLCPEAIGVDCLGGWARDVLVTV
jgi:hypothetical protein